MKSWIILLACLWLVSACHKGRAIPAASQPCLIGSCASSYDEDNEPVDRGYHSFIAMVETMNTLDWEITFVDVNTRTIHARSCPWEDCVDFFIKTFRNGELVLYPAAETRMKHRTLRKIDLIVDRFSEISCFSAGLIENRL